MLQHRSHLFVAVWWQARLKSEHERMQQMQNDFAVRLHRAAWIGLYRSFRFVIQAESITLRDQLTAGIY